MPRRASPRAASMPRSRSGADELLGALEGVAVAREVMSRSSHTMLRRGSQAGQAGSQAGADPAAGPGGWLVCKPLYSNICSNNMEPMQTPSQRLPATRIPATRFPATGLPATGLPATGLPATGLPATGLQDAEIARRETPAHEPPALGIPAPETPAEPGGLMKAMSPGVVDFLFRQLVAGESPEDLPWQQEGVTLSAQPAGAELARRLAETDLEALTPTELFHYVRAAQRLASWAEGLREAAVTRYCQPALPSAGRPQHPENRDPESRHPENRHPEDLPPENLHPENLHPENLRCGP